MKERIVSFLLIIVLVFSDYGMAFAEDFSELESIKQTENVQPNQLSNESIEEPFKDISDKLSDEETTNGLSEETSNELPDESGEEVMDDPSEETLEELPDESGEEVMDDPSEKAPEELPDEAVKDSSSKLSNESLEEYDNEPVDKAEDRTDIEEQTEDIQDNSKKLSLYAAGNPYSGGYWNCTYAAWQLCYEDTGHALPAWSNAITWYNSAMAAGYTVSTTPRAKSIAVWGDSGAGHVGYVTGVSGGQIYVKEGGYAGTSNGYHEGWLPASGYRNSTQYLIGYIYIPVDRTDFVDLGTNFKALILRTDIWHPIVLDGSNVVLAAIEEGIAKEQWIFNRQSDGSYIIKSCYSGNVLDVANAGTVDGTNVGTYEQWGTDNGAQKWYIFSSGSGYMLVPKCARALCLDVAGGLTTGGTNIQIWTQNNTPAQVFSIYKLEYNEPESISISRSSSYVEVGNTLQLYHTILPLDARHNSVMWTSSNTDIASVDQNGKVKAKKAGTVEITCTTRYSDKIYTNVKLTVTDKNLSSADKPSLKVTSDAYNKLKLSWDEMEKANGYIIYRSTSSNGTYKALKKIESKNTVSYIDTGLVTNKNYYYKIRAYQQTGDSTSKLQYSAYSSVKSGKPIPTAPGGISVKAIDYDSVRISWNAVNGANGYMVYRSTSSTGNFTSVNTITNGSTLYCSDNGLTTNKNYYYKVKAYRWVNGKRVYSMYSTVKIGKSVLAAPSNVSVKLAGYNSQIISWNKVNGASGYMLYRSTSSTGNYTSVKTITNGNTVSCKDTSLATGTVYYYKVKAYRWVNGARVYSGYSVMKSGKTVLASPSKINVKAIGYNSIKISWNKVSGAGGYMVYRANTNSGKYSAVKTLTSGTTVSCTDSGVELNKLYYYKVKAYRWVNGKKVYSDFSSIKSEKTILGTPSGFGIKSVGYNSVNMSWKTVPGAGGYVVYRATSSKGTYKAVKTITNGNSIGYTNSGLITNKVYYYKVKAYRWVNGKKIYGGFCAAKSIKPVLPAPTKFNVTSSGDKSIKLSWNAVPGASGYMVYRSTSNSGVYSAVKTITSGRTVSFTNSGLTKNKTYYYKVKAYRWVNGNRIYSNNSSIAQATTGKLKDGDFYYTLSDNQAVINGYTGKSATVTVPSKINGYTVVGINPYGMLPSSNTENVTMKQVILPSSLEWIGAMSFIYCTKLEEVKIPSKVKWIGANAFMGCSSLKKITIPASVTELNGDISPKCNSLLTYYVIKGSYAHTYLKNQGKKITYI